MKFTKSGGQTGAGPKDWFTGTVQIDGIRNPDEQSAIGCAHVRFAPGARTAWHHHPKGQTLYVTDGIGLVPAVSERCALATSSTSNPARSTGTAPPRTGSWPTWPSRKPTRAAKSSLARTRHRRGVHRNTD